MVGKSTAGRGFVYRVGGGYYTQDCTELRRFCTEFFYFSLIINALCILSISRGWEKRVKACTFCLFICTKKPSTAICSTRLKMV